MENSIIVRDKLGRIGKGNPLSKERASRLGKLGGRNHTGWCDPEKAATEHPTVMDIAWAAGLFEGEGTPSFSRTTTMALMAQKDPWVIHRFRALFGGSITQRALKSGKYEGSQYWYWTLGGARARGFLMTIYKFLSPRRQEQVREALGAKVD